MKICGETSPDGKFICNVTRGHPGTHAEIDEETYKVLSQWSQKLPLRSSSFTLVTFSRTDRSYLDARECHENTRDTLDIEDIEQEARSHSSEDGAFTVTFWGLLDSRELTHADLHEYGMEHFDCCEDECDECDE